MSVTFLERFFPSLTFSLKSHTPSLWLHVFPVEAQARCVDHPVDLAFGGSTVNIRWATLAPLIMLGVAVGAGGYLRLRHHPRCVLWSLSFATFACMNMSALFCHCLVRDDHNWGPTLVGLDVGFTCCSSLLAAVAVLSKNTDIKGLSTRSKVAACAVPSTVALAVVGNWWSWPLLNEVMYLGMVGVAVACVSGIEFRHLKSVGSSRLWAKWAWTAVWLAAIAPLLDRHLCEWVGSSIGMTHLVFLGCDLIFFFLLMYLLELQPKLD